MSHFLNHRCSNDWLLSTYDHCYHQKLSKNTFVQFSFLIVHKLCINYPFNVPYFIDCKDYYKISHIGLQFYYRKKL